MYLGKHHPDLARIYLDMAMDIDGLLSRAPRRLFALELMFGEEDIDGNGMCRGDNFYRCSMEDNRCRKEYGRIRDLYPKDVEDWLV